MKLSGFQTGLQGKCIPQAFHPVHPTKNYNELLNRDVNSLWAIDYRFQMIPMYFTISFACSKVPSLSRVSLVKTRQNTF